MRGGSHRSKPTPFQRPRIELGEYPGPWMRNVKVGDVVRPAGWRDHLKVRLVEEIHDPGENPRIKVTWTEPNPITNSIVSYHLPEHRCQIERITKAMNRA